MCKNFLILLLSLFVFGCQDTISSYDEFSGERKILTKGDVIYVAVAKDYSSSKKEYKNSGKRTSEGIVKSLKKFTKNTFIAEKYETVEEALVSAKTLGAKYMLYPEIISIRDVLPQLCVINNTDKIDLTINVYSVETKKSLKQAYIIAEGCPMRVNGIPVGATKPTSHVEKAVKKWNIKVFQ